MDEIKNSETVEVEIPREYITEDEAKSFVQLFRQNLQRYKEKDSTVSNQEWLAQLLQSELPYVSPETAKAEASELIEGIHTFDQNLTSVNKAAQNGVSKEHWLADKIQESSVSMSVTEYGQMLQATDDFLYQKNMELSEALSRSADGHIMMSPNLDGNIAENLIAKTTELSGHLQGKNIKVEVLESFTANSVDVRATNLDTGKYHNYQLKFGKDAKATIALIERGNYNNQRVVVPTEQLEEVQAHFRAKGSNKTITDHIDAWGAKGKKYTKADLKAIQTEAQASGVKPSMEYSQFQTRDLAMSIGKNSGVLALQTAAVTTGLNIAAKICRGEKIDSNELVEIAVKTGTDTSIKVVTAGTLEVAIRKGLISIIPKATPAGIIANIACVGIENVKVLAKIASGGLSLPKGLEQMGRTTTSMIGGLWGMAKGAALGAKLAACIPVIGAPLAVATGFVGGTVGYFGGSKVGDAVHSVGRKVSNVAKSVAKTAVNGIKSVGRSFSKGIKSIGRGVKNIFRR